MIVVWFLEFCRPQNETTGSQIRWQKLTLISTNLTKTKMTQTNPSLIPPSPQILKEIVNDQDMGMMCMPTHMAINEVSGDALESPRQSSKYIDGDEIFIPDADGLPTLRVARFHCKARGVPDLHNPRTAIIDVPLDTVEHGEILICSHRTCSTSGRRFRYCKVCRCPVAKYVEFCGIVCVRWLWSLWLTWFINIFRRNFVKRHGHGILKIKRRSASYVSDSDSSENCINLETKQACDEDLTVEDPLHMLLLPTNSELLRLAPKDVAWLDSQSAMVESISQDDLSLWLKGIMDSSETDVIICSPVVVTNCGDLGDQSFFAV